MPLILKRFQMRTLPDTVTNTASPKTTCIPRPYLCATEIYFADVSGYLPHLKAYFMHIICEKNNLCVFYFCTAHNSDKIWRLCRSLYGRKRSRRRHLWHILSMFQSLAKVTLLFLLALQQKKKEKKKKEKRLSSKSPC